MRTREKILSDFMKNFIITERQERCFFELLNKRELFIRRLSHNIQNIFKMKLLKKISKNDDFKDNIQKLLNIENREECYIVSNDSFDNHIVPINEAIDIVYGQGLGSLFMNLKSTKIFLEAEQEQGPPDRFIGIREYK